jgi:NADPH:quinone reductase-like Zn-dependent oxidoreductase
VESWAVGDRVALTFFRDWEEGRFEMRYHKAARGGSCDGVLSEKVVTPVHSLVRIPEYLSFEEAATLPCAAVTSWHALMERSRPLAAGQSVLCLGTGGVSVFSLQIAKAVGARVIITSSSEEKLKRAKNELGADDTINYREREEWDDEVFTLTEKRGVDHVIEVGGPGTLTRSMNSVAAGGSIALIGVLTGFEAPDSSLFPLVARNVDLSGMYVGNRSMFERMMSFFETNQIRPVIDSVFDWNDVEKAYSHIESAKHFGKIVIRL